MKVEILSKHKDGVCIQVRRNCRECHKRFKGSQDGVCNIPQLLSRLTEIRGYSRQLTAAMKICAVIFLYYLAIDADANERKKVCKEIMGKLSDLKDLIIKKQDCYTVGKVQKIVSMVYIKFFIMTFRLSEGLEFRLDKN